MSDSRSLTLAILDYVLRIREAREIRNIDIQTLWSHASETLQDSLFLNDVDQTLKTMEEDSLIHCIPAPEKKTLRITVTGKGELHYQENRHLLAEIRRKNFIKRQKRSNSDG